MGWMHIHDRTWTMEIESTARPTHLEKGMGKQSCKEDQMIQLPKIIWRSLHPGWYT